MIIVTGCPRSGTSLTMDLMREALGEEAIIGEKFPQEKRIETIFKKKTHETDNEYQARIYQWQKRNEGWEDDLRESKDMNPNGFWECRFTVGGVSDRRNGQPLDILETGKNKVCKIVSQGLARSDPKYVDKIVLLLRHPRQVAKSQERLKRSMPMPLQPTDDRPTVHTPAMFNRVSYQLCHWLLDNPDKPILPVVYDNLVESPQEAIKSISEFIGLEGDWSRAASRINTNLKRSQPGNKDGEIWEDAEHVWALMVKGDYQGVVDYFDNAPKERPTSREGRAWLCPRAGKRVNEHMCEACRSNEIVRENYKKEAANRGVDWANEPCLYEVAYGPDNLVKISIEESVKNNFWVSSDNTS